MNVKENEATARTATASKENLSVAQDTKLAPKFKTLKGNSTEEIKKELADLLTDVKAFPYKVFPRRIQVIIEQTSECLGFHPDIIAGALLVVFSTAIGNTYRIYFKNGFVEPPILYLAFIAGSGKNKTAPLKWAMKPLDILDADSYKEYESEVKEWKQNEAEYRKDQSGAKPHPGERPQLKKIKVEDYTPEALYRTHAYNKRSLLLFVDELISWIKNFNKYSSGSEQEAWMSMWNGLSRVIDRVSKDTIRIENPFINVMGSLQPAVLENLVKDQRNDNGFLYRMLFIWPENLQPPSWESEDLKEEVAKDWERIIKEAYKLQFNNSDAGEEVPNVLKLSDEARKIIIEWRNANLKEDAELDDEVTNAIFAKIQNYVLRFSLIIQLMRKVCGEGEATVIDAESAKSAIVLAQYFKRSATNVQGYIRHKNPLERLALNKQSVYNKLPETFETGAGVIVATDHQMSERAFKEWLKDATFFKRLKQGHYSKVIL